VLDSQKFLGPDETVIAQSEKRAYGLVFQILFNRACPAILIVPLIGFAIFKPAEVLTAFSKEPRWLIICWSLILSVGVAANIYLALEYLQSSLLLTSERILRVHRSRMQPARYSDVQKVDVEDGLVSSEIKITLKDSVVIQIDYLDKECASFLARTINELRSSEVKPSSA